MGGKFDCTAIKWQGPGLSRPPSWIIGTLSTDDGNGDGDGRGYWENPNYQTRMSGAKMPSRSRHVAT